MNPTHRLLPFIAVMCAVTAAGVSAQAGAPDDSILSITVPGTTGGPGSALSADTAVLGRDNGESVTHADSSGSPDSTAPPDTALAGLSQSQPVPAVRLLPEAGADTAYAFWKKPFWGLGIGWTLGSYPLFPIWEKSLAGALGDLSLSSPVYLKLDRELPDSVSDWDTVKLYHRIQEKPNTYNLAFPAGVMFTFHTGERSSWAVDGTFSFLHKTYQASVEDDSADNRIDIRQTLGHYLFTIGLTWSRSIPSALFSIDKTEKASLALGAAVSPVSYIEARAELSSRRTSLDTLFLALKDSIGQQLPRMSAWGLGVSWKIGLATLRRYSDHSGLNAGLYYVGRWLYFFDATENELGRTGTAADNDVLSCVCHRLLIQVELLRGRKPPAVKPE